MKRHFLKQLELLQNTKVFSVPLCLCGEGFSSCRATQESK